MAYEAEWSMAYPVADLYKFFNFFNFEPDTLVHKSLLLLKEEFMSKEKVIEIKINDVTYIVSEVNRNDDHLKQIIKDMLIEILNYEQKK